MMPPDTSSLIAARSVPVDSAALYEAVNAYVDALTANLETDPLLRRTGLIEDVMATHRALIGAAEALALHRYEQRRATERQS